MLITLAEAITLLTCVQQVRTEQCLSRMHIFVEHFGILPRYDMTTSFQVTSCIRSPVILPLDKNSVEIETASYNKQKKPVFQFAIQKFKDQYI